MHARALRLLSLCKCDVNSKSWYSVRLLDFSYGCDEALETGSVYLSDSLQSGKETLCTTRDLAIIKGDHLIPIGRWAPAM